MKKEWGVTLFYWACVLDICGTIYSGFYPMAYETFQNTAMAMLTAGGLSFAWFGVGITFFAGMIAYYAKRAQKEK